jgi:hypothetical protein
MQRRVLLSLVNIGVAAGALFVIFGYPRYANYAIYIFLAWFVVSFSLVWAARGPAPVGRPAPGMAVPTPSASPSGTGPARGTAALRPTGPPAVGFCIYCATDLPDGADRCPACGHAGARLA